MNKTRMIGIAAALASTCFATPALAATSTRVVITQDQQDVPETRIQLFDIDTGAEVKREEDEDETGALFLLDGGRYRVVVDGTTVREIAVSGAGSELFDIGLPPSFVPAVGTPADPAAEYVGQVRMYPFGTVADLFFGGGRADAPQTGTGFMRDGPPGSAPETFAQTTPGRVSTLGGAAVLRFGKLGLKVHYFEGDAANSFEIPGDSGIDSGVVYGDDADSGSSGIATGRGLTGGTEVDQQDYGARIEFDLFGDRGVPFENETTTSGGMTTRASVSVYAAYDHVDRDYTTSSAYAGGGPPVVFTFSQDRQQEVGEDYFGLGLSGRIVAPLGGGVFGHLTGAAGGYYRDTDLTSVERNLCNFCPASDRDFIIAIDDSDDGFGFHGEVGAALELRLSPAVSLFVGGSADYWSSVGAIFNPSSGDEVFFDGLNTALRTEDVWPWRAGGGLIVRFR